MSYTTTLDRCLRALLFTLLPATLNAAEMPATLRPLFLEKEKIALALSEPIARCVQREDTRHAAFHGCIDWHSAVHGTWALVAYTAMTGDKRYEKLIGRMLTPEKLAKERQLLRRKPAFEMPYGRAWLLRLAIEHERHYRNGALLPLGDVAAARLASHYRAHPPEPTSASYDSASWAFINLLDYYRFRNRSKSAEEMSRLVRKTFLKPAPICLAQDERPGFMAVCSNWAWLVSKVTEANEFAAWLNGVMPASAIPVPVSDPQTAHEYGLNFSRSWGLWELFRLTGNEDYARSYAEHFRTTYDMRDNWDGDYAIVGHWVGQFGMLAVQPLFGDQFR